MTHDELLADIKEQIEVRKELGLGDIAWSWNALRAVVELTKTKGGVGMNDSFNDGWVTAMQTVFQAIEKELA